MMKTQCNSDGPRLRLVLRLLCILFVVPIEGTAGETPRVVRDLHWAVTEEKFELAMERLRSEKQDAQSPAVILSHGLFVNSRFLNLDGEHSLARYLVGEGFDVWNLSSRGTGRSLDPLKGGPKRWNLDDMIEKDLPAVIRYVQKETGNSKVSWVGYEAGGLLLYGYLTKKKGAGIAAGITLGAPVTFHHDEQEPMKRLLKLDESPTLKKIFLYLNAPMLCKFLIPLVPKIAGIFFNPDNVDDEILQKALDEALTEINPGVLDHLLLMIRKGEFVSADGNFSYRKSMAGTRTPLLVLGGEHDRLAPPEAMRAVYRSLAPQDRALRIFGPRAKDSAAYGHFDLILGNKSPEEVYPVVGKWLKQKSK
ncbi:MAG: alpha/beta fold hydrolase [Deltaproteobacteria bacterium]|nr:alpha/beta fold hydrolase [Deltaproteobacteria bacterium]